MYLHLSSLSVSKLTIRKYLPLCLHVNTEEVETPLFTLAGFLFTFIIAPYNHPHVFQTKKTPRSKFQTLPQQSVMN